MSRAQLRQIRQLKARFEPLIAERDRRRKEREKSAPARAEAHLLKVILVFRHGQPRIDEPLALAYRRALKIVGPPSLNDDEGNPSNVMEILALDDFRRTLEREQPAGNMKQKISAWVNQMPDWLRHLCDTGMSMVRLNLKSQPLPEDIRKFRRTESDERAWPNLPQGMLQPPRAANEHFRVVGKLSVEEAYSILRICEKPKREWTRRERRFNDELIARHYVPTRDP
jgi:hypothetical protein